MAITRLGTSYIHDKLEHVVELLLPCGFCGTFRVPAPPDVSDEDLEALVVQLSGYTTEVADAAADQE